MKNYVVALTLSAIAIIARSDLQAQIPQIINYQGRVVVGTTNFNGTGQFRFALVNAAGTTTYWSNDGTSVNGSQPTNFVSLTVSKGLYSVLLGDTAIANMSVAIPTSVFNNSDVRLRVWFNDGTTGSQLLAPDQRIASAGYAMNAGNIVDGAITAAKIATGAVGSTQLATGSVSTAKIANGAVGATQLGSSSVGATQIVDASITAAKISTGQVVKSVNGLTDAVTLTAGTNVTITPSGNSLTVASTGGSSVWSLNGTTAFYSSGSVGIGQNTTSNYALAITEPGGFDLALSGPSPVIKFVDTSAANAQTAVRAVGGGLRIFNNAGATLADFESSGNVGLGNAVPAYRLHLNDATNSVTEMIETGGGTNAFCRLILKTNDGLWTVGTSQNFNGDEFYIFRGTGSNGIQLQLLTNGQLIATTPPGSQGLTHTDGTITVGSYVGGSASGATGGWFGTFTAHPLYFFTNNGQPSLTVGTDGVTTVKVLSITGGSDLAEPFPIGEDQIEKGSVVVIDPEHAGRLMRSRKAYDRKVAGIVSGANGIHPGIALHQEGALDGGENVALSGRVYVQAETSNGFIEPGDLLTTSKVPGCAMKVTDYGRAQGAVIGKAMSSLHDKSGTVLVLVTLQ